MKIRRSIFACLAIVAGSVAGLAADQDITLTADVPKFCKFDAAPRFEALTNFTVGAVGLASSALSVSTATGATGIMNDASFRVKIAATCNFPSTITLASQNGGLKDGTPEPIISGVFLNRIDYQASLSEWDSAGLINFSTSGTPTSVSSTAPAAHAGDVVVLVDILQNTSAPLAAGDYTDTLRISLTPQ